MVCMKTKDVKLKVREAAAKLRPTPNVIGFITIGIPFLFKLFTIYILLSPGGQGELQNVFFYAIMALNFLCLVCLGIMWTADLRDVVLDKRMIHKKMLASQNGNDIQRDFGRFSRTNPTPHSRNRNLNQQAQVKWIALAASILNTLSSIAIAAILYTQETSIFNVVMVVISVLTILFDVNSLFSILIFYQKNPELMQNPNKYNKITRFLPHKAPRLGPITQATLGTLSTIR